MPTLRSRLTSLTADLPPTFWFLWVGTLVNRLGGFVVPFLTLYLTSQRGASPAEAALIVSMAGAGSFLSQLVGGELTDRLGRRPVMLLSFLITPIAILALGLVQAIWLIVLAVLASGFFTDLYRPAVSASVADLVPAANRTRAFGYIYWAINLGAAVAPILAGFMASYNYLLLFVGDALTTFIFGLIVLWRVPETQTSVVGQAARVNLGQRLQQLKREPILLAFTGLSLLFGSIYMQNFVTLPLDMQNHGLSPADYGLAIAVNGGLIVLVTLQLSQMVGKWPRFTAMALAALLLGLGYGAVEFTRGLLPLYALTVAIWTLGEIIGAAIAPVIVTDLAPEELRGLYLGIFGSAWGLSFFIGPLVGGWVFEQLGPAALWRGCLLLGVVLALSLLGLGRAARERLAVEPEPGAVKD